MLHLGSCLLRWQREKHNELRQSRDLSNHRSAYLQSDDDKQKNDGAPLPARATQTLEAVRQNKEP